MKIISLLSLSLILFTTNSQASTWCEAYIDAVVPTADGITVLSTSSYNGEKIDVMKKEYSDSNFGNVYMRLLDAKDSRYEVRLYPVSGKGEEDGAVCDDGVTDYLRSVYRPF